ncbi:MAG TPA: cold shock domain-containing protein [Acidimicrobiales bacterium]|nr:cold shock domain-containing protein [Acidimicrobiales bacterium]
MPGRATPGTCEQVTGRVATFDERRGLGTVVSDDGRSLPFHCTAIADGSRTIDVGARVTFSVVAGHLGQWEATGLARLRAGS